MGAHQNETLTGSYNRHDRTISYNYKNIILKNKLFMKFDVIGLSKK